MELKIAKKLSKTKMLKKQILSIYFHLIYINYNRSLF